MPENTDDAGRMERAREEFVRRDERGKARDLIADERDRAADERDRIADVRDRTADARDRLDYEYKQREKRA